MWFEPRIDWASNETMNTDDWNAIIYDADYILTAIGETAKAEAVLNYLATDVMFLSLTAWQTVREYLDDARETLGFSSDLPTDELTAEQLNKMEMLLLLAFRAIENERAVIYTGEGYTNEFYAR